MTSALRARTRPSFAARLRPGERPGWWNASRDRDSFGAWRSAAAGHGVCLDALIAALIELDLVLADLRALTDQPQRILDAALERDTDISRLGPCGPWRGWLSPATQPYEFDELPELVLPERLIARLTPGRSLDARIRLEHTLTALACDRVAARNGRTLESWALHAALHGRGAATIAASARTGE